MQCDLWMRYGVCTQGTRMPPGVQTTDGTSVMVFESGVRTEMGQSGGGRESQSESESRRGGGVPTPVTRQNETWSHRCRST
jgi:hypothetical protein